MRKLRQTLAVTLAALITMVLLLWFGAADDTAPRTPASAPVASMDPTAGTQVVIAQPAREKRQFYFDVVGHSADQFRALLERAYMIYEQTPAAERGMLRIAFVLHGPDVEFMARANADRYRDIIDLAAKLDAYGVFDFKMCTVSANRYQLDAGDVPDFIEFVAYGPQEIERLERAGFVRL